VMKGAKWALRCFYREGVKTTDWTVFDELRIAEPKTIPVDYGIMSQKLRTRIPYNVGLRN